jgi:hypothetical protein
MRWQLPQPLADLFHFSHGRRKKVVRSGAQLVRRINLIPGGSGTLPAYKVHGGGKNLPFGRERGAVGCSPFLEILHPDGRVGVKRYCGHRTTARDGRDAVCHR